MSMLPDTPAAPELYRPEIWHCRCGPIEKTILMFAVHARFYAGRLKIRRGDVCFQPATDPESALGMLEISDEIFAMQPVGRPRNSMLVTGFFNIVY
jgi:hypothetical protein